MDPAQLARWERFAARGGLGTCTAVNDCVAEVSEDLMFYADDVITVLKPFEDQPGRYLGYCEGVIGRFSASDVRFHSKLKKLVTRRREALPQHQDDDGSSPVPVPPAQTAPFPDQAGPSQPSDRLDNAPNQVSSEAQQTTGLHIITEPAVLNNPTVAPSSTTTPLAISSLPSGVRPSALPQTTRSSFASVPDSSLPHTPGDVPEAEQKDLHVARSTPPLEVVGDVPIRAQNRDASVVSALVEKAPFRDSNNYPVQNTATETEFSLPRSSTFHSEATTSSNYNSRTDSLFDDHPGDESDGRVSADFSDGEFGIGMQFIQGLVDQQAGAANGDGTRERTASVSSEDSIARPPWRTSISSEQPTEEGVQVKSASQQGSHIATDLPASGAEVGPEVVTGTPGPPSLQNFQSSEVINDPTGSRPASSLSGSHYSRRSGSVANSHRRSLTEANDDNVAPAERSKVEADDRIEGVDATPALPQTDDNDDAGPSQSPVGSTFESESDEGYYEEDANIYDDYRYSRYSMMSRKSRKSVIRDTKTVPLPDGTAVTPLPPPPPPLRPGREGGSEHASSPRSPTSPHSPFSSSPKRVDFPPPLPLSRGVRPLQIPGKTVPMEGAFSLNTLSPNAPPLSPALGTAMSSQFASNIRQRIEEEVKERVDGASGSDNGGQVVVVGSPKSSASRRDGRVLSSGSSVVSDGRVASSPRSEYREPSEPPSATILNTRFSHSTSSNPRTSGSITFSPTRAEMPISGGIRMSTSNMQPSPAARPMFVSAEDRQSSLPVLDEEQEFKPEVAGGTEKRDALSPQESALANLEGRSPQSAAPAEGDGSPVKDFHSALQLPAGSTPFRSPSGRPLTFLPHPNAPKPVNEGPSQPAYYAHPQRVDPPPPQAIPLYSIMSMAAAHYAAPRPPHIRPTWATIHGRLEIDLSEATGPVRIEFFVDRDGRGPPPPPSRGPSLPQNPRPQVMIPQTPLRANTVDVGASIRSPGGVEQSSGFANTPNGEKSNQEPVEKTLSESSSEKPVLDVRTNVPVRGSASAPMSASPNVRSQAPSSPLAKPPLSPLAVSHTPEPDNGDRRGVNETPSSTAKPVPGIGVGSPRPGLRNVSSSAALRQEIRPIGDSNPPRSLASSPLITTPSIAPTQESRDHTVSPTSGKVSLSNDDESVKAPSVSRSHSLRSKISLAHIKSKRVDTPGSTPGTPAQYEFSEETIQVKEGGAAAEFEIIRPVIPRIESMRSGEDIGMDPERLSVRSEMTRNDTESHRSASPVVSTRRNGNLDVPDAVHPTNNVDTASIEAHRAREGKWLATMSSVTPPNAKKSKKVRKLVQEGIPNSVRSVVWLYLTNAKSQRMNGLYAQLCARVKPTTGDDIRRDAASTFPTMEHLHNPIVSLLQAYLVMVPDITYQQGLAAMAGTLLLQSPEEDAFWTFVALMENHIRGYYARNSIQMLVDAKLFQRVVETADHWLAKRIFVDLAIDPMDVCRPWFYALFANALPEKYLYRVWDMFIYDGVTWLFRVALNLLLANRKHIMDARSGPKPELLDYLFHPPAQALPADPDAFVTAALGLKVKEDELRKLRSKLEGNLKPQQGTAPRPTLHVKDVRTITAPSPSS
ncbi:hypothetical protein FRB99_008970 [Tulasnella sp. 403]|nr:hypothetical protein FRB99_008970 [Tulasnella sp. 403]